MKNSVAKILFMVLILNIGTLGNKSFGQDLTKTSSEIIENLNLVFSLDGIPSVEELGFTDRESSWKFKYELRLTDDKKLGELQTKLYSEFEKKGEKSKWILKANKKLYKKWRRSGASIYKGNFNLKHLSLEDNSSKKIFIPLISQVKDILNRMNLTDETPNFILAVKGRISTKLKSGKNYKINYEKVMEFPMSFYKDENRKILLYNTFGIAITLTNENDSIRFDISRR